MILLLNNTPVDLLLDQEITTQENSPLEDLKQKGDKTFSFVIPNNARLRTLLGNRLHLQSNGLPEPVEGRLMDGPYIAMQGTANLRKNFGTSVELNMTVPPGGIQAEFWNSSLQKINMGSYTLPSEEITEPIYTLKTTDEGMSGTYGRSTPFGRYYLAHGTTLQIKVNGQEVFSHRTFTLNTYFDGRRDIALNDLQGSMNVYNSQPVLFGSELYAFENEIVMIFPSSGEVSVKITWAAAEDGPRSNDFDVVYYERLQPKKHFTSRDYLRNMAGKTGSDIADHLTFPMVFAPNYLNGNIDTYNGWINRRVSGELQINNYQNRLDYPISQSFRVLWIIDTILSLFDFKRDGDWSTFENLAIMPFIDFARQHPDTQLPYNVYPVQFNVAEYMPDITVKQFFEEFTLATGGLITFDVTRKTCSMRTLDSILAADPYLLTLSEKIDTEYIDLQTYKVAYGTIIEDELTSDALKAFLDYTKTTKDPTDTQRITTLSRSWLPVLPLPKDYDTRSYAYTSVPADRANGYWIGRDTTTSITAEDLKKFFVRTKARSVVNGQNEEKPVVRLLFVKNQLPEVSDGYTLDLSQVNSLTATFLLPALQAKTGIKINLKVYLSSRELAELDFLRPVQFMGNRFLLIKKEARRRAGHKKHETTLELEVLK